MISSPAVILLVALALAYVYLNGVHDSSNMVATVISSRAMGSRAALLMTAAAVFAGPFLLGVGVANTIGSQVIAPETVRLEIVLAALAGAIVWSGVTWVLGIPSSSSHALIGGMIGAALSGAGASSIQIIGLEKVLAALFLSPLAGLFAGFGITRAVFFLARHATPRANGFFKRAQIATSLILAVSYGANDAQKTMGIITLGLVGAGAIDSFGVPDWVKFISAAGLALGSATGGWRLIRTLGGRFFKIKPVDGFCTQAASAMVVFGVSLIGGPVSTTQVVSTAIMGVGAAERINKVRWGVAMDIALAWLVTIPGTAVLAAGFYWVGVRLSPILFR